MSDFCLGLKWSNWSGQEHLQASLPLQCVLDGLTLRLVSFLREGGVTVGEVRSLDCPYAADSHEVDILEEVRRFRASPPDASAPLLVPDTAVNSLGLLEAMRREAGRQVLTANQVTLWAGLRRLAWPSPPARYLGALASLGAGPA